MLLCNAIALASFQFTHPGRGATTGAIRLVYVYLVSIHAPREGCDALIP